MNENLNNETLEQPVENSVQPSFEPLPEPPKKKKKGKGLIIFLIVVLIIGGLIFGGIKLFKYLTRVDDPFPDIDTLGIVKEQKASFVDNIEKDYAEGTINKEQYLMQLAYSIFEPTKLDVKYSSLENDYVNPYDLFEKLGDVNYGELSPDAVNYLYGKYFMDYIQWDPNLASQDEKTSSKYNASVKRVMNSNPITLDKVKLSKKGHFLIYYSTQGENAISDETASLYADFLESHVKNFKKEYGLDFKYKQMYNDYVQTPAGGVAKARAAQLLIKNKIDIKYMDSAMPIYLLNLYDINTPAFYVGADLNSNVMLQTAMLLGHAFPEFAIGDEYKNYSETQKKEFAAQTMTASFTYAFPYAVVNAGIKDIDDSKLLSAHEMFHHYQKYICGDGKYGECSSGNFTIETTANLAAVRIANVNSTGTVINDHAYQVNANKLMERSIKNVGQGYGAFVFAYNYANIVKNGTHIMNQSVKYEDPLSYLYNNSNGKYKEVLITTAEKNLTLDYKNKQVLPYEKGNTWSLTYPAAHEDINVNHREDIFYSSMHYYYANPSTLGDSKIYFKAGDYTSHELTLLMFVKENNKYRKVYSQNIDDKFVIKASDWIKYDEIAFSVIETSISNDNAYYILNTSVTIDDEVTITPKSLGLKEPDQSKSTANTLMCYRIEDSEMFKTVYQAKVDFDREEKINGMYIKGTIRLKDYDPNNPAFKIAKRVVSGLIFAMRVSYKEKLKSVKISTSETDDTYTILFKVKDNYDEAFKNNFEGDPGNKQEIKSLIESRGFICE